MALTRRQREVLDVIRELIERIESALADLPASYAMAFHLRIRERFSYREIASMCGEPEGTLRSRIHHTLGRIRKALDEESPRLRRCRPRREDPR